MKQLLYIIMVLFFAGCNLVNDDGIHFKMVNSTDQTISNIQFYTSEKVEVYELPQMEQGEIVEGFLSMRKNKTDGGYLLEYTDANGAHISENGYYTNGASLDNFVRMEFQKDTVLYSFRSIGDY